MNLNWLEIQGEMKKREGEEQIFVIVLFVSQKV